MTKEQVVAALAKYEVQLSSLRGGMLWRAMRWPPENPIHGRADRSAHILWMCSEARKHLEADKVEKAMRWLGFIQGVLWADSHCTIAELKDDNR